ncbi:protein shisa-5-like isoform X1 [Cynoglossus semilaevis]|uniref:protein shisa-5-like isoform X1 n=1 Tax=Cynoglossus semilaevis TaxID=244447 RepID=UPI000D623043|nr:protein shisa-5-like isoform X1 [Cynoglossus semilaevis]
MASSLLTIVVVVLCAVLAPCVSARDSDCLAYDYHSKQYCHFGQFCCGTCRNRYCCSSYLSEFSEDQQELCLVENVSSMSITVTVISLVSFILIIICCCVCPCCCLYKMCRKPQPVLATTTHTTIVTSTPQHYPQQPTATHAPSQPYQSVQYPPYQPVPVQPGYGAQPMPATQYQAQPFTPGPPPSYQEASPAGPAYPPNPMPYSQAAFSPNHPPYPMQPPAQHGASAPPPQMDFLTQPAYNPDFMAPKTG